MFLTNEEMLVKFVINGNSHFVSACSNDNQNVHQDDKYGKGGKIKIIEYGDFKCPYCKK